MGRPALSNARVCSLVESPGGLYGRVHPLTLHGDSTGRVNPLTLPVESTGGKDRSLGRFVPW